MINTIASIHKGTRHRMNNRFMKSRLLTGMIFGFGIAATTALPASAQTKTTKKPARSAAKAIKSSAPASAANLLTYHYTQGESHHYKVLAFFSGHFPPFAQPDSPTIHLKALIDYVAAVKKVDAQGATIAFTVEHGDLSLLDKEAPPDGKVDPETETPFPIALEDIQKALNATAVLRPDGSVASLVGGNKMSAVRIDIGFDLRKLFLLIMPISFAPSPVAIDTEWTSTDGLLGSKAGRTTYKNRVVTIEPAGKSKIFHLEQNATARVEDSLNKEGNSTAKPEEIDSTLSGDLTLTGTVQFMAQSAIGGKTAKPAKNAGQYTGRVSEVQLTMNALLVRKQVKPDPDKIMPPSSNIDVHARMMVHLDDPVVKPTTKPGVKKAAKTPTQTATKTAPKPAAKSGQ